ncbi:metal-dependent hydrolase [Stutzerimonas kunmingensis]|uniref:metal-dependent hydrolase n=1 Tax=Stutzerimonas kunmingensis TaxID=1211807 RepID=UPI0028A6608B|nr:metal-dependent hydrolase [Stutzerimonas kunmingensis]
MRVRSPTIDFSDVRPDWAPNREFAQYYNAASTVPAHVEPFLVKVMMRARDELAKRPGQQRLLEDVEIFIKQEVQHCKRHVAFNQRLYDSGYAGMRELEAPYEADYRRWLEDKPLRFLLAYSEGFEAMGSSSAEVFFTELDDYLNGADESAVTLWKWHLAEEFEHRSVCFDVYKALYGDGLRGYLYRLHGFVYAITHIGRHVKRVNAYLLAEDRCHLSEAQHATSVERERQVKRRIAKASLPRLLKVFSPRYDPATKQAPAGMAPYLEL